MPDGPGHPRTLELADIERVLPHRYPFLLVDRILALSPGVRAVGVKAVSFNEPFFAGHFPGHPVMPAVLITEAMAQVAGVVLLTVNGNEGKLAYFTGIDRQRFRKPVLPGDLLVMQVEMLQARGNVGKVKAEAWIFRFSGSDVEQACNPDTRDSWPVNQVLFTRSGEGARERLSLMGLLEGELAADGELMFALRAADRSPDASPQPASGLHKSADKSAEHPSRNEGNR